MVKIAVASKHELRAVMQSFLPTSQQTAKDSKEPLTALTTSQQMVKEALAAGARSGFGATVVTPAEEKDITDIVEEQSVDLASPRLL